MSTLKSIPMTLVAYFKSNSTAVDDAKKERRIVPCLVYLALYFISTSILVNVFLSGVERGLSHIRFVEKYLPDLKINHYPIAILLGLLIAFTAFIGYLLSRLICTKIFARGTKKVLLESFIEFSMHSLALSAIALIGALLCSMATLLFTPIVIFGFFFIQIVLVQNVSSAVDSKKQNLCFQLTVALLSLICFTIVFICLLIIYGFIIYCVVLEFSERINDIINAILENIEKKLKTVFQEISSGQILRA